MEFENTIPKKIQILWPEENIHMIWEFENIQINSDINDETWEMPDMLDKIDMGLSFSQCPHNCFFS